MSNYNEQAQIEVREVLLSFLADSEKIDADATAILDDGIYQEYNQEALENAIVCIMDAFGYQFKHPEPTKNQQ